MTSAKQRGEHGGHDGRPHTSPSGTPARWRQPSDVDRPASWAKAHDVFAWTAEAASLHCSQTPIRWCPGTMWPAARWALSRRNHRSTSAGKSATRTTQRRGDVLAAGCSERCGSPRPAQRRGDRSCGLASLPW